MPRRCDRLGKAHARPGRHHRARDYLARTHCFKRTFTDSVALESSPGSIATAASPKILKPLWKAPSHGCCSPASSYSCDDLNTTAINYNLSHTLSRQSNCNPLTMILPLNHLYIWSSSDIRANLRFALGQNLICWLSHRKWTLTMARFRSDRKQIHARGFAYLI